MECFIILHVTFKIIGFSKQETIDKWLDWLKQYLQERENSNGKRLLILDVITWFITEGQKNKFVDER